MKLLIFLAVPLILCMSCSVPATPTPVDPALQQQRLDLINEIIDSGIFAKVELPGDIPYVWVTSSFYLLDFDDKDALIGVVYAYYYSANPKSDFVMVYDNKTGKKIGVYTPVYGGLKLD